MSIKDFNIFSGIWTNISGLLSITFILVFIGSIGFNIFFWLTNNKKGYNFSEKIEEYQDLEDSLKVHISILKDDNTALKTRNKILYKNSNTIELSLLEQVEKTKLLEERLEKIKQFRILTKDKKLTNEEIDIWLYTYFGSSN